MKAPDFWWRDPPSPAARLLSPAALAYGAVAGRRMARPGTRAALPVVCVGNFTAGGAGKTPAALAVAALLEGMDERPAFLSRGHGGRLAGPVRVDPALHGAGEVGDEPLLLARAAPTIVSRDRPAGADLARALGATVVVMDDGLQNPSLAKDLAVAVVDGATGVGNGLALPAGPLRAPLSRQWPRVDAVLIVGEGAPGARVADEAAGRGLPVIRGRLVPDATATDFAGMRVLAFAGIGRPGKFFGSLEATGAEVVRREAFPDHHPYRPGEIAALLGEARRSGLVAVTTAKDRVRLEAAGIAPADLAAIRVLPVSLAFDDPDRVRTLLEQTLAMRRG